MTSQLELACMAILWIPVGVVFALTVGTWPTILLGGYVTLQGFVALLMFEYRQHPERYEDVPWVSITGRPRDPRGAP